MTLSSDLQTELDFLLKKRGTYAYTGEGIEQKTLVGLIAPTAVGKSTVIKEILRLCDERDIAAGEVGSITTRSRREDGSDPDNYRTANEGVTHEKLISDIKEGGLVNWSFFATGDLYATDVHSYPATYNFLPLQPDSLEMLERAGFKKVVAIYLTAPVDEWAERLVERRQDPKFSGRIAEAQSSLAFAKTHTDMLHVIRNQSAQVNGEVRPTEAAERILEIALGHTAPPNTPEALSDLDEMLTYAQKTGDELSGTTA